MSTAEDIDRAIKYAMGMRYASIGLLEYYDAVGFELERAIALNVYPDLCNTKEIQKTTLDGLASGIPVKRLVGACTIGRKKTQTISAAGSNLLILKVFASGVCQNNINLLLKTSIKEFEYAERKISHGK